MSSHVSGPVVIIGAGPYGLSLAAHLAAAGIPHRIFGAPMRTWRDGMPAGMLLKSEGFASSLSDPGAAFTLAAYCAERNLPYADTGWGVPVEVFAAYGEAFQRCFVPHLETVEVRSLARAARGFAVTLDDGRTLVADRVVLATGLRPFAHLPDVFEDLPGDLVSHSRDAADLGHLAGRTVAVIGGGASALDVAASLHRAGAHATVIARRSSLRFFPPGTRGRLDGLRAPQTPLGPGWKKWLCATAPLLFRLLPAGLRHDLVRRHLGPAPAYSVKEVIEAHVRVLTGASIRSVTRDGERVRLTVQTEAGPQDVVADHVVAATGYRIDLSQLAYLDPTLRTEVRCIGGAPVLSSRFETSAPGLHVVGTAASPTFGPLLRFVCGAGFAARRLTRSFRVLAPETAGVQPEASAGRARAGEPRLAFLTLSNDVGSERIVAQLSREGAACAVVGTADSYAMTTRHAARRVALPRFGGPSFARILVRGRLERLLSEWQPDRIIPLDELAARVLRRLVTGGRISPGLRALIIASTGDPATYALGCSREGLLRAAVARGLRVPDTRPAPDLAVAHETAADLGFPVVLKREETCGSGGVTLVREAADLPRAYAAARRRAAAKRALGWVAGLVGGEDAREARAPGAMLGLQRFVPGRLAMHTVACRDGRVLDGLSLVAQRQHPVPIGTSTIVSALEHDEMAATARVLVRLLRLSGFASFDFLLDADGRAHLIELNPRPIGSTHLGALFGHDLCGAYLADLAGTVPQQPAPAWSGPVALFPRELARDPFGGGLGAEGGVLHDVPVDDPAVVERCLAHLARLHPSHALGLQALLLTQAPTRSTTPIQVPIREAA